MTLIINDLTDFFSFSRQGFILAFSLSAHLKNLNGTQCSHQNKEAWKGKFSSADFCGISADFRGK